MTTTHGGKRVPGPGKKLGRPATGQVEYLRIPIVKPRSEEQLAAIAWWESLTPRDRLWHLKELHSDCGWPKPHIKTSSK